MVGRGPVRYASQGSGERTLMLLHPIGLDWRSWAPAMLWFPANLRVLAVDLHGFGGSGTGPPLSLEAHADDLAAFLDDLGLSRIHMAGLSYGGSVAGTFAARYPERTESLALVAAPTSADPQMFLDRAEQAEQGGHDSYVDATIARWFRPETVVRRPATVEYTMQRLRATPVGHWAAGWRVLSTVDLIGALGGLRMPVAVVAGEHDPGFPPDALAAVADGIPGATFHCIEDTAHMVGFEAPFPLAAALYQNVVNSAG